MNRLLIVILCVFTLWFPATASASTSTKASVSWIGTEAPGTIVVVNQERALFLVLSDGRALRYDVAIGRSRAQWVGSTAVHRKAVNPPWSPTANMRKKNKGMQSVAGGSPKNPLGARALYLHGMYRIHGTNAPESIGKAASSGCIRMHNADVIDLYTRVGVGTPVKVINSRKSSNVAAN